MRRHLKLSNRRGGRVSSPNPAPSGSVFLVSALVLSRGPAEQARTGLAPNPGESRIQKTFSAVPCSFSSGELWFPETGTASQVQPVADSQPGRIASTVSCRRITQIQDESRRLQSALRARWSNPYLWLAATLENSGV